MKNLLLFSTLFLGFIACSTAQGTFMPINGPTSRVKICDGGVLRNATAEDGLQIGVFVGRPNEEADVLVGTLTIGPYEGLMVGMPALFNVFAPGIDTQTGAQISLRYDVRSVGVRVATSGTKTITLAHPFGPGTVVWGSTPRDNRFSPLIVHTSLLPCIPEPSTLKFAGLTAAIALFVCRSTRRKQATNIE